VIEITADMHAIIKQAILSFVATVNEDGTPNLSPKASLTITNGILYFADIASPQTILNLGRSPEYPVDYVVRIETTSIIPLLSPAHIFARPPRSPDEIRDTYYQKHGVNLIKASVQGPHARGPRGRSSGSAPTSTVASGIRWRSAGCK
jgi:uncharacterized protein